MNAGDVLETLTFTVTRADLVAYADASGDQNPIHQDEDVARSVGLPGVIAHGMYTLALVGRAVAEWTGGAEVVDHGHLEQQAGQRGAQRLGALDRVHGPGRAPGQAGPGGVVDRAAPEQQPRDRQAAVEARILLPARKDR